MTDHQVELLVEMALDLGGIWLLIASSISYLMYFRCKFAIKHPRFELLGSKNQKHQANVKEGYRKAAKFSLKVAKYSLVAGVAWLIVQWGYALIVYVLE